MSAYETTVQTDIDASPEEVWAVLVDNDRFGEAMFGSEIVTDWKVGGPIVYQGEFQGTSFRDTGTILEVREPAVLRMTHFSPSGGQEDVPENHHELRFALAPHESGTRLTLTQGNNKTQAEADHSRSNWEAMLQCLKGIAEQR